MEKYYGRKREKWQCIGIRERRTLDIK